MDEVQRYGVSGGPGGAEGIDLGRWFATVLRHRDKHGGRHLHHRNCIHNLPPEEQVAMCGKSVEWWLAIVGPLPEQITPEQWECEPPGCHPTER